jgi:AcrR family transcriptional regulator
LKQADMSKGSLYHHFGDKFGLYLAMMDIIVNKKLSYFYPILRQNAEDTSDFFAMLKEIMKGTLEFMLEDERLHHLFNRVMEEREDFRSRVYSFFPMDYAGNFSEFVRQAVQSGQIDPRYPPDFVAKVVEIMFANIHKLVSVGDPNELLNIATQVVDMIQYGISR